MLWLMGFMFVVNLVIWCLELVFGVDIRQKFL